MQLGYRLTRRGRSVFTLILVALAIVGHHYIDEFRGNRKALSVLGEGLVVRAGKVIEVSLDNGETWGQFDAETGRSIVLSDQKEGK